MLSAGLWAATGAPPVPWQPAAGHEQIALWPGKPPGTHTPSDPETAAPVVGSLVAGKPWTYVTNVSQPTLTLYAPKTDANGAAVVVFPGGGYRILAIDLEGTEVCDWLNARGIACLVLKYRVPHGGDKWSQSRGVFTDTGTSMALEDAQRALGLVRLHAAEWHIDPHKIGVLGFSAGGHLVAAISTRYEKRVYPAVDAADKESCRPDFAVALYPGHLWLDWLEKSQGGALNRDIRVTKNTPPTFIVQAENDDVDDIRNSLFYYAALQKARVPAELHVFPEGGHAFGLRRTKMAITAWPELAETWMRSIGMLP